MIFKLYECDFGFKINGQSYDFTHVNNLTIEDPENTRLVRGGNAGDKFGIPYREGTKEGKKITVTIMDMGVDLKAVLDQAFKDTTRLDVYAISRSDGSSKIGKDCVLCQQPQQLSIDEGAESMNVVLTFETFNLTESYKS